MLSFQTLVFLQLKKLSSFSCQYDSSSHFAVVFCFLLSEIDHEILQSLIFASEEENRLM